MNSSGFEYDGQATVAAMREQIRATPMAASRRWGLVRHPRLGGIATALAVLAGGLVVAIAIPRTPPAFAVTPHPDGTVTITLRQLTAVKGLNAKLASMGIRVRAARVVRGCRAPVRVIYNGHPGPLQTLRATPLIGIGANGRKFRLGRLASITVTTSIDPDRTLVLAASQSGLRVAGQVVQGAAPHCVGTTSR